MIVPTYVTFPQAKRLKEIGFNEPCEWLYNEKGEPSGTKMGMRGQPNNYSTHYARPEQWQVLEWLRVEHGIWIRLTTYAFGYQYHLDNTPDPKTWNIDRRYDCTDDFKTPQAAYSAAFDYILSTLNK
jgi:hypothetical protein